MNDYIKREDAIEEVCKGCNEQFSEEPCEPSGCCIRERLSAIQTVDVVEVVRCADCKWYNQINNGDRGYCGTPFHGAEVYEDDYCSDGERVKE